MTPTEAKDETGPEPVVSNRVETNQESSSDSLKSPLRALSSTSRSTWLPLAVAALAAVATVGEWWEMHTGSGPAKALADASELQAASGKSLLETAQKMQGIAKRTADANASQARSTQETAEAMNDQILIIRGQLRAAQALAEAAQKQADLLNKSISISTQTANAASAQLKATQGALFAANHVKLDISISAPSYHSDGDDGKIYMEINIHIENKGDLPAYSFYNEIIQDDDIAHQVMLLPDNQKEDDAEISNCFNPNKRYETNPTPELAPTSDKEAATPGLNTTFVPKLRLIIDKNPAFPLSTLFIRPASAGFYMCTTYKIQGDDALHGDLYKVLARIDVGSEEFSSAQKYDSNLPEEESWANGKTDKLWKISRVRIISK